MKELKELINEWKRQLHTYESTIETMKDLKWEHSAAAGYLAKMQLQDCINSAELLLELQPNSDTPPQLNKRDVSLSLPFDEVKSGILAHNAKSEYKQAAIVILRDIYSKAGGNAS